MNNKSDLVDKFGGEGALGYNVLATALRDCAKDDGMVDEYQFLDNTPRTTLVVVLMDKIRELGYNIYPNLKC